MPELPEVETVRRALLSQIAGLTITNIDIRYPNMIDMDVALFKNNIINKEIKDILRLGKYLIFSLNEGNIISHLRMEGKYFYALDDALDNKHIHVIFYLSNGYRLYYQDVRKFGRMYYKENNELYNTQPLNKLGIDPIINKEIDILEIHNKIIKRITPIKTVLLDQSIITGLGNIYVDEVLFKSAINPNKIAKDITYDEAVAIINNSIEILNKAIELKGTTIRSYTSSLNVIGGYQDYLLVHTKTNCPICSNIIKKIKIGGRSTYYCEKCQR